MPPGFEKCPNCGAPLETAPDGRSVSCVYCGAGEARALDPSALAASLQADVSGVHELYERLAARLERDLPDLTQVVRGGGLFSAKRVERFELALDGTVFGMRRDGRRIAAERAEVVRGIVVKTEELPVDDWLQALSAALAGHAGSSARTLAALRRLTQG